MDGINRSNNRNPEPANFLLDKRRVTYSQWLAEVACRLATRKAVLGRVGVRHG